MPKTPKMQIIGEVVTAPIVDAIIEDSEDIVAVQSEDKKTVSLNLSDVFYDKVNGIVAGLQEADKAIRAELYYDHIVTTEEEFLNIESLTGRILVKNVTLTEASNGIALKLSASTTALEIANLRHKTYGLSLTIEATSLYGSNGYTDLLGCTVMSNKINAITFKRFRSVTNCRVVYSGYISFKFENCNHITNSNICYATTCDYIENCRANSAYIGGDKEVLFNNCRYICGITTDSYQDGTIDFRNCSYLSNINAYGTYTGCTYVDAETCKGYVAEADVGKVQKLTADGSLQMIAPLSAPVAAASFETVPRVKRNTSGANTEVDFVTLSPGSGGNTVPIRDPDGSLRAKYNKNGEHTTDDTLINQGGLNAALVGLIQGTIYGEDIAKGNSMASAIKANEYGMYIVKGEDVTVTFTANDAVQTVTSDFHIFVKYMSVSGSNKIIHLYLTSVLNGYVKSFDGTLASDLDVKNGSSQYGCRVVKMKMKEITS